MLHLAGAVTQPKNRKNFCPNNWILDCGSFGEFHLEIKEYADQVERWCICGQLDAVVAPDYLCQPQHLRRSNKSVAEHQEATIANYDALRQIINKVYIMPTLQGLQKQDYIRHLKQYGDRLPHSAWVGVGSLVGRHPKTIAAILSGIKEVRQDLRLHGFGCGKRSLRYGEISQWLWSADTMAWSLAARREKRNPDDPFEAQRYLKEVEEMSVQKSLLPLLTTDVYRD
ncbi:MAG: hypothetical protein PUP91_38120 [Rhizonema sp. PD37]|nr:hypothetical protein [Rhizonema sp. PD37]